MPAETQEPCARRFSERKRAQVGGQYERVRVKGASRSDWVITKVKKGGHVR